jgi:3-methyl-2-oxobutanoate hydroxymethyltransferase
MSLTPLASGAPAASHSPKITVDLLLNKKRQRRPITALTAYDFPTARLVDESGIDMVLVGDSLAMAVLGMDSTLPVTMEEMLHHTRAVRRGVRRALLVADLPFGSYHASLAEGVTNGVRFVKEGGAEAVKLEGARPDLVERLAAAEVPVIGHLGLTPQSLHKMGGYKVQGKTAAAVARLRRAARRLEQAGAAALVLEGIPREVAAEITGELEIPTIGIGAGPDCDGQILVLHDLLGLTFGQSAKFVRRYADLGGAIRDAVGAYRQDVEARQYPSEAESYHLPAEVRLETGEAAKPVKSPARRVARRPAYAH